MPIEIFYTYLALTQEREGAVVDALQTVELGVSVNNEILACRPEALRVRGELRLQAAQTDQLDSHFHNSIALARKNRRESVGITDNYEYRRVASR